MIGEHDLDRALITWFAEAGMDRAPEDRVQLALEEITSVRQRRAFGRWWPRSLGPSSERLAASRLLAFAIAVALLMALAYGIGSRILERTVVTPVPSPMLLTPPSQAPIRQLSPAPSASPSSLPPLPSADAAPPGTTATFIAGLWSADLPVDWAGGPTQPMVGGVAIVGSLHTGPMVVSIGSIDGRVGDCDAIACRLLIGATSLSGLERSIGQIERPGAIRRNTTLAGDPARSSLSVQSNRSLLYRVYAIHAGRPVLIRFELEDVAFHLDRDHADEIVQSFAYEAPAALEPGIGISGGTWSATLPQGWILDERTEPNTTSAANDIARLSIRNGDEFGRIAPCSSASSLVSCDPLVPESLDALFESFVPTPDQLKSGPRFVRSWFAEHALLDGEPAIVLYKEIYGVGGPHWQALADVIGLHDGRPFDISVIIKSDFTRRLGDLREILTAVTKNFRFTS